MKLDCMMIQTNIVQYEGGAYLLRNAKFANNTININGRQCVYGVIAREVI